MEEKRKMSRVPFQVRARIERENQQPVTGSVENVSLNGLLVKLPESASFLEEEEVEVTIDLAEKQSTDLHIHVMGKIVRTEVDGYIGLTVDQIDLDSFVHLKNILAYNSGDYDKIMGEFMHSLQNPEEDS